MLKSKLKSIIREEITKSLKEDVMPLGNYRDFGYEQGKKDFADNKYDVMRSIEEIEAKEEPLTQKQRDEYFKGYYDAISVKVEIARKALNKLQSMMFSQEEKYRKKYTTISFKE